MRRRRSLLTTSSLSLCGLLLVAVFVLTISRRESGLVPSAYSVKPSGVAAFAELLRRQGYDVRIDRTTPPQPAPDALVIAATNWYDDEDVLSWNPKQSTQWEATWDRLTTHQEEGGKSLTLYTGIELPSLQDATAQEVVEASGGRKLTVNFDSELIEGDSEDPSGRVQPLYLWQNSALADVSFDPQPGFHVSVYDAYGVTNRYIAQHDNAAFYLDLVRQLASPGQKVVFWESAAANAQPVSLLDMLGPWARPMVGQALFLFVVIVYSLGKRFGLAEDPGVRERGSRELVDAVADTYARAKATPVVLQSALSSADLRIRQALKIPRDAPISTRNRELPAELVKTLSLVEAAVEVRLPPASALAMVRKLETQTEEALQAIRGAGRERR